METLVYTAVTIVLLALWIALERTVMTPYDIYRKWKASITYVAPEELGIMLAKTSRAITAVEEILDASGPSSDAGVEAIEVLVQLRKFYSELRIRGERE